MKKKTIKQFCKKVSLLLAIGVGTSIAQEEPSQKKRRINTINTKIVSLHICDNTNSINSARFNNDDRKILSASSNGTVQVTTKNEYHEPIHTLLIDQSKPHDIGVNSAEWNYDSSLISTALQDGSIKLWRALNKSKKSWRNNKYYKLTSIIEEAHNDSVNSIKCNFTETTMLSASDDGTIKLWDLETLKCLQIITNPDKYSYFFSAGFNTYGTNIVTTSDGGIVHIWDVKTCELINTLNDHTIAGENAHSILAKNAEFSPNSDEKIITSGDLDVKLWDIRNYKLIRSFKDPKIKKKNNTHACFVNSAKFSPIDKFMISSSDDGTIKIWDRKTGDLIKTIECGTNCVKYAEFNNNNKNIVYSLCNGSTIVYSLCNGSTIVYSLCNEKIKVLYKHKK